VFITGEPGIGKTRLLAWLCEQLDEMRIEVRRAALDETDVRRPHAATRALFPDLDVPPAKPAATHVIDAGIELVERRGTCAVVVDDAHWCDEDSLDLVAALGRRAEDLGILVAIAARATPTRRALHRLEDLADSLGTFLRPAPLGHEHIAELVIGRFGAPPGANLEVMLAAAAGNPFLVNELCTTLEADRSVHAKGGTAEVSSQVVTDERLSRRLARRALAAVPDGEMPLRLVAVVPGGMTPQEIANALGLSLPLALSVSMSAIRANVLVDNGRTLSFHHDLLRQAVSDTTPPTVVQALLSRAAETLADADPDRVGACLLALGPPSSASARSRLLALAAACGDEHAATRADLLRSALDSMDDDDPSRHRTRLDLGWALVAAGRATEVDELLQLGLSDTPTDEPIELHRLRGIATSLTGRIDLVTQWYRDADLTWLTSHYDTEDPDVVDAAAEQALLWTATGQLSRAREFVDWAANSPTASSPFRRASIDAAEGWMAAAAGRFEDGQRHAHRALDHVRDDLTRRATPGTPMLILAVCADQLGDAQEALRNADPSRCGIDGPRWSTPMLQFFRSVTLYRQGAWDDALTEIDAGFVAADECDFALGAFWPHSIAALIARARSDPATAQDWLQRGAAAPTSTSLGREWLALASALIADTDGSTENALVTIESMLSAVDHVDAPALLLNGGGELVELCLRGCRADLAWRLTAHLEAVAGRTSSPIAAAHHTWAAGLVHTAAAEIERAATALEGCSRLPEAAKAWHHAAVLHAPHDRPAARRCSMSAFAIFDQLGADTWHRRLRADLATAGIAMRPRRSPPRAPFGWSSLTDSELAVVQLVGQGLTNSETAAQLFVSRRTVESHLRRIYTKVNVSSRAQLIGAVARGALSAHPAAGG
jgi:DNA-binding CsgD family transcriptional regulator